MSVNSQGAAFGVTANASGSRGKGDGTDVTWTNTQCRQVSGSRLRRVAATGMRTSVRPLHWKVLTGAALVIAIGAGVGMHFINPTYRELGEVQRVVSAVPGVGEVGVSIGTSSMIRSQGGATTSHGAAIFYTLPDSALQCEQITPQVAKAALQGWPEASHQDYLSVICMRSVELGIAYWRNQSATVHSPTQWAAQLGLPL